MTIVSKFKFEDACHNNYKIAILTAFIVIYLSIAANVFTRTANDNIQNNKGLIRFLKSVTFWKLMFFVMLFLTSLLNIYNPLILRRFEESISLKIIFAIIVFGSASINQFSNQMPEGTLKKRILEFMWIVIAGAGFVLLYCFLDWYDYTQKQILEKMFLLGVVTFLLYNILMLILTSSSELKPKWQKIWLRQNTIEFLILCAFVLVFYIHKHFTQKIEAITQNPITDYT